MTMFVMGANEGTFRQWSDEGYPRPQLCRPDWVSLNGAWDFDLDPSEIGLRDRWYADDQDSKSFALQIEVPYPPGSELSGVLQDSPETVPDVVWYARTITPEELARAGTGSELRLNFEAVDFAADVWVDGQHAATHKGGYTPFSVSLGANRSAPIRVVVRAEDRREDTSQPRGKQAWRNTADGIWYHRSNGIWRDVWIEAVPSVSIEGFHWTTDLVRGALNGTVAFSGIPSNGSTLRVELVRDGVSLGSLVQEVGGYSTANVELSLPQLLNRMDWSEWLWSPDHPNLLDVNVELVSDDERDMVVTYVGLRTVELTNRYVTLNGMPVFLRGVLDQGYWPQSFFTAPSAEAIKEDVELILALGFNLSRVHERTPDRRYLTWADRVGLLVWGESASTYRFDERAITAISREWEEIVIRDRAAPSIITWVPFNESWGISDIEHDPRQRAFVESVVALTRALDQTRPVSANDGWEQLETDLVTTHDYGTTYEELFVNYKDTTAVAETVNGVGPQGRKTLLGTHWDDDKPVLVSEFGGISMGQPSAETASWGYDQVHSPAEFKQRLSDLVTALLRSPVLAGFCYTQLTDTLQETNGILNADRSPKIPVDTVHRIMANNVPHRNQIRPRPITAAATSKEMQ